MPKIFHKNAMSFQPNAIPEPRDRRDPNPRKTNDLIDEGIMTLNGKGKELFRRLFDAHANEKPNDVVKIAYEIHEVIDEAVIIFQKAKK